MNADDYAILIGISHYPELGEGNTPADLRGPNHDVEAVKAWLLDPLGGGFPDDRNIHVICSTPAATATTAHPTADELELVFAHLDVIAQENKRAEKGLQVGRRLYLYISGHGFSPGRQKGCLFTANATGRMGFNVHVTGWLNWLQDAGYFREFVFWMDTCMNRMTFMFPRDPPLPLQVSQTPPLANFVAFAAQRPLKAVEVPIAEDRGVVHGAFTWALLEGLRGAAADVNGRVSGHSLANWIRNAQSARYMPADRTDRAVAKEPEILQEDDRLIFARGVSPPRYRIRLTFPREVVGETARLWSGSPPQAKEEFQIAVAGNDMDLRPGLYLVEVPQRGLRQGFEVVCPAELQVVNAGPPALLGGEDSLFNVNVNPGQPAAEIFVIDCGFSLVDASLARLSAPLPFGLYKIKTRIGDATSEDVILLDRDISLPDGINSLQAKQAAVMPIPDTATSHESHGAGRQAAIAAANELDLLPTETCFLLMARAFSARGTTAPGLTPWGGVRLDDVEGNVVVDLERDGTLEADGDAFAFAVKGLVPGCYFLRQTLEGGRNVEQSVILCAGWRTEVYILHQVVPGSVPATAAPPKVSIMMRGLRTEQGDDNEDRILETARMALANERRVLSAELEDLLLRKFTNPMAGIIGGHLLLIEKERDPNRDITLLKTVVENLTSLVGVGHPDVAALASACTGDGIQDISQLVGPPMLEHSWKLLVQAAQRRPELIPRIMWSRVQGQAALPPFLVWTVDESVKSAARAELARAILGITPIADVSSDLPGTPRLIRATRDEIVHARGLAPRDAAMTIQSEARKRAVQMNLPPCVLDDLLDGRI